MTFDLNSWHTGSSLHYLSHFRMFRNFVVTREKCS